MAGKMAARARFLVPLWLARSAVWLPSLLSCGAIFLPLASADPPPPSSAAELQSDADLASPAGMLQLVESGYQVLGTLESESEGASDQPPAGEGTILWRHPALDAPFHFPLAMVKRCSFPDRDPPLDSSGEFAFSFHTGDVIYGDLREVQGDSWRVHSNILGLQDIPLSWLRAVERWNSGQVSVFRGPGKLAEWYAEGKEKAWSQVGNRLQTSTAPASIVRAVGLQGRSQIEIALSWEGRPNFVLALGVDPQGRNIQTAFRIEVWDSKFVFLRELENAVEIASLGNVDSAQERVRWLIDVNQLEGRASVYDERGKVLASLEVGGERAQVEPAISISNLEGNLAIESLRVDSGRPILNPDVAPDAARFVFVSGEEIVGQVTSGGEGQLQIRTVGEQAASTDDPVLQRATNLLLAARFAAPQDALPAASTSLTFRAVMQGGDRISGQLVGVRDGRLWLVPPYGSAPWGIPLDQLSSLLRIDDSSSSPPALALAAGERVGLLQMPQTRLAIILRPGLSSSAEASCLQIVPVGSNRAANLGHEASGSIEFPSPEPDRNASAKQASNERSNRGFLGAVMGTIGGQRPGETRTGDGKYLHLRRGDSLPGAVLAIDAEGVLFRSRISGDVRIPHAEIRAVEFNALEKVLDIDRARRQRLLTVPRARRDDPPRHLLVSNDGDYLVGSVVMMNEEMLRVAIGLRELEIPRRLVSKLLWFHEDEIIPVPTAPAPVPPPAPAPSEEVSAEGAAEVPDIAADQAAKNAPGLMVQVLQNDGIRLTLIPTQVTATHLEGTSSLLGKCQVPWESITRLIFGRAIDDRSIELPFQPWRLSHAPLPRDAIEGEENGGEKDGTLSPLVGQKAPDVSLKTLAGDDFRVQQYQGKVLVLDFWASWCGPCIQAMPKIDAAISSFDPQRVALVAINLEEPAERITATLERMGIEPTVALDLDGVAAARYQATAIPQTVIIDSKGVIRRVFVGATGNLEEQLKQAVEQVLGE